jgi:hypothetical protein
MLDRYLKDEAAVQRMRALPVGSHLDAFAAVLSALGYARYSIRDRLWTLAALGRWLKRRGLSVIDLRREIVAAFLRPRTQRARVHRGAAATLAVFLEYLEQEAIIPPEPSSSPTPIALLKARYEAHLHHDEGCRPSPGPDIGLWSAGFCGSGSARVPSTRTRLPSRTSRATSDG